MATLVGPIQLRGRLGNLSFFQNSSGDIIVRSPGGPAKGAVSRHPNYQRTRENNSEFGRAQQAAVLFTRTFAPAINRARDGKSFRRLHSRLLQIIKMDTGNARGQRTVRPEHLALLDGFDFNEGRPLTATLRVNYDTAMDVVTGNCSLTLPSFIPSTRLVPPADASHFRIRLTGGSVDFESRVHHCSTAESDLLPINEDPVAPIILQTTLDPALAGPRFLLLTLSFYETLRDGSVAQVKGGNPNASAVIAMLPQAV